MKINELNKFLGYEIENEQIHVVLTDTPQSWMNYENIGGNPIPLSGFSVSTTEVEKKIFIYIHPDPLKELQKDDSQIQYEIEVMTLTGLLQLAAKKEITDLTIDKISETQESSKRASDKYWQLKEDNNSNIFRITYEK